MASVSDSCATLEKYLTAQPDDKPAALGELLADLRSMLSQSRWEDAASILRQSLTPNCDFTTFQSLYRIYSKLKPHIAAGLKTRLAILGGFTTTQLAQAIEPSLFATGGCVDILEADFGVYRQEILDPSSEL